MNCLKCNGNLDASLKCLKCGCQYKLYFVENTADIIHNEPCYYDSNTRPVINFKKSEQSTIAHKFVIKN